MCNTLPRYISQAYTNAAFDRNYSTKEQSALSAVELAKSRFGRLDGLILNAGTLDPLGRIESPESSVEGWKTMFDINLFSTLHLIKAGLPLLRESKGRVIFVR
jgi:NAD(P)-dependent dehydrogenase (short-subunit alcohol dehydrogenase family)